MLGLIKTKLHPMVKLGFVRSRSLSSVRLWVTENVGEIEIISSVESSSGKNYSCVQWMWNIQRNDDTVLEKGCCSWIF